MGRTACTEPQCLYKGVLYLYLWSWKSRAIRLVPLWAVRPVQSLSACTRVHFTFTVGHEWVELYLYSPYGPYGLYRASVPVQGGTLSLHFYIYTRDASWKPNFKILGHERSQHDRRSARVIAQQYSSTTHISVCFRYCKKKCGALLNKCSDFILFHFL